MVRSGYPVIDVPDEGDWIGVGRRSIAELDMDMLVCAPPSHSPFPSRPAASMHICARTHMRSHAHRTALGDDQP
jgi:hypothetical protein